MSRTHAEALAAIRAILGTAADWPTESCTICHATGKCQDCDGTKYEACNGSCYACSGTGKVDAREAWED